MVRHALAGDLLGDAVDVSPTLQDLPGRQPDDLTVRAEFSQDPAGPGVADGVVPAELRDQHRLVGK